MYKHIFAKYGYYTLKNMAKISITVSRTDRLMDRWTDRPSYRDARMHLKRIMLRISFEEKYVFGEIT